MPVGGGLRLVLVRCWSPETSPSVISSQRCLPYAVVHVTPGAWLRGAVDASPQHRRECLADTRRLCSVAEALHDAILHGAYATTLLRERKDAGVPATLVCDPYVCAYASCMQAYIRSQHPGLEMDVKSCLRVPMHHSQQRFLSFVCFRVEDATDCTVEEWYLSFFGHHVCGSAPTVEFASQYGQLRNTLSTHPSIPSWTLRGSRVLYHSAWAFEVVTHAIRHRMHQRVTRVENEAVVLVVSTKKEPRTPSKKTVCDLDSDAQLEAVLRVAVHTPLSNLPVVTFQ